MIEKKFDPAKLERLNNPERLLILPPAVLWESLGMANPEVLVDIGAGTAFFSVALLPYAEPSRIYACDLSQMMVDWVRDNIVPDYPQIIPVKSEEVGVPLDDTIADLVFMINLHHELDQPGQTLREAWRLLKPGGKVLIVDWRKQEMSEGPPVEIRCATDQVMAQLADAGFTNVTLSHGLAKHFLLTAEKAG